MINVSLVYSVKLFIRKYYWPLLLIIFINSFFGCAKDILIQDAKYDSKSYSMFGKEMNRIFFEPLIVSDSIRLKWSSETHGGVFNSSIIIQGNYIFAADLSGRVYSFNINSGKQNGYLSFKGSVSASPILDLLKLIIASNISKDDKSIIHNYDIRTGKEIYKIDLDGIIMNDMLKLNNGFIFSTEQGKVYRYNFNSDQTWEYNNDWFIHTSAAANKNTVVFGDDKGFVTGLDVDNGKLIFKKQFKYGFYSGFSVSGDTLYAGDKFGYIYAININNGNVIWYFDTGGGITNYPVMDDVYVYIGNLKGNIYKLEKSSGKIIWEISTDGVLNITPILFKNRLIQPDLNKKIYFIDVESGKIVKVIETDNRPTLSPIYFDGTLFLGTDYGQIFAYEFVK